ncbi:MAG: hypothetical protein AAF533_05375 [Acidobacteriota bacterium]
MSETSARESESENASQGSTPTKSEQQAKATRGVTKWLMAAGLALLLGIPISHLGYRFASRVVCTASDGQGWSARILQSERKARKGHRRRNITLTLQLEGRWGDRREVELINKDFSPRGPVASRDHPVELAWSVPGRVVKYRVGSGRGEQLGEVHLIADGLRHVLLPSHRSPRDPVQLPRFGVDVLSPDDAIPLDDDVRQRLARLPLPPEDWSALRMIRLEHHGFHHDQVFTCDDENVLLVFGPHYGVWVSAISRGPILVIGSARMRAPASDRWIFFDDYSHPWGEQESVAPAFFATRSGQRSGKKSFSRSPVVVPARPERATLMEHRERIAEYYRLQDIERERRRAQRR